MTDAEVVMNEFMKKLSDGELKKENQPNDGPEITKEFIASQLESYTTLLKSGIIESALGE